MGRGEKRLGDRDMGKAQQNEETALSRGQSEGAERQVSAVAQMSAQDCTALSFPRVNTHSVFLVVSLPQKRQSCGSGKIKALLKCASPFLIRHVLGI